MTIHLDANVNEKKYIARDENDIHHIGIVKVLKATKEKVIIECGKVIKVKEHTIQPYD